ncbi:MAG TPA: hypothetical protein DCS09_13320 [Porphyromonadaceae bacterium]|nr:hypothetical protein [Porphyromonadaceae bacterium]
MNIEPGYEPLAAVLQEALDHSQSGKGAKCHANGKPFLEQPIMTGAREAGEGGLVFQSRKKILEAFNCTDDKRAISDMLGAINYVAAQVILRREKRYPAMSLEMEYPEQQTSMPVVEDCKWKKLSGKCSLDDDRRKGKTISTVANYCTHFTSPCEEYNKEFA